MKKRSRETEVLNETKRILKILFLITYGLLMLIYLIRGGLYSLLFDIKESKSVIVYSVIIIVLLVALILLNVKDEPEQSDNYMLSSYITVGIIIVSIIFGLLLIFTLIDFFLPIIVLSIIMVLGYFVSLNIAKYIINKSGNWFEKYRIKYIDNTWYLLFSYVIIFLLVKKQVMGP